MKTEKVLKNVKTSRGSCRDRDLPNNVKKVLLKYCWTILLRPYCGYMAVFWITKGFDNDQDPYFMDPVQDNWVRLRPQRNWFLFILNFLVIYFKHLVGFSLVTLFIFICITLDA
jgi:hypothetical protein